MALFHLIAGIVRFSLLDPGVRAALQELIKAKVVSKLQQQQQQVETARLRRQKRLRSCQAVVAEGTDRLLYALKASCPLTSENPPAVLRMEIHTEGGKRTSGFMKRTLCRAFAFVLSSVQSWQCTANSITAQLVLAHESQILVALRLNLPAHIFLQEARQQINTHSDRDDTDALAGQLPAVAAVEPSPARYAGRDTSSSQSANGQRSPDSVLTVAIADSSSPVTLSSANTQADSNRSASSPGAAAEPIRLLEAAAHDPVLVQPVASVLAASASIAPISAAQPGSAAALPLHHSSLARTAQHASDRHSPELADIASVSVAPGTGVAVPKQTPAGVPRAAKQADRIRPSDIQQPDARHASADLASAAARLGRSSSAQKRALSPSLHRSSGSQHQTPSRTANRSGHSAAKRHKTTLDTPPSRPASAVRPHRRQPSSSNSPVTPAPALHLSTTKRKKLASPKQQVKSSVGQHWLQLRLERQASLKSKKRAQASKGDKQDTPSKARRRERRGAQQASSSVQPPVTSAQITSKGPATATTAGPQTKVARQDSREILEEGEIRDAAGAAAAVKAAAAAADRRRKQDTADAPKLPKPRQSQGKSQHDPSPSSGRLPQLQSSQKPSSKSKGQSIMPDKNRPTQSVSARTAQRPSSRSRHLP